MTSREAWASWASGADPANNTRADCYWLVLITLESQLEGLARPQSAQPLHALMILESRLLHCAARQMQHEHTHTNTHPHTHMHALSLHKCLRIYTIICHKSPDGFSVHVCNWHSQRC